MITQRGGEIANAFSGFNVSVYGFKLGFAGLAAFEFGVAIYAIVQGYGFWKLEAWGWWLYIIADIITLILGASSFSSRALGNTYALIGVIVGTIVNLVLLWYLVTRRELFKVKLPVIAG